MNHDDDLGEDLAAFADRNPPPHDPLTADRLFRRLAAIEHERATLEDRADAMIADIKEWLADTARPLDERIEYLRSTLVDYARATGQTSLSTPYGKVRSQKGRDSLKVTEAAEAIAALEAAGLTGAIKRDVAVAEAKKLLVPAEELRGEQPYSTHAIDPRTGEVIPGLTFANGGRTYTVSLS